MDALQGLTLQTTPAATSERSSIGQAQTAFGEIFNRLVTQSGEEQQVADQAVQQIHAGDNKSLHEAMLAMEKADISLRYTVQVRNKVIDAYQEIMRMQV